MRSSFLRINIADKKQKIEENYLVERHIAYMDFILCLILGMVALKFDMSRVVLEEAEYNKVFKENCYITDLPLLMVRLGVTDPHRLAAHIEYVEEFLNCKYHKQMTNYFSLGIDSGYHIYINLRQTRL